MSLDRNLELLPVTSGRPEYGIWPIAKELELEKYGGYILAFNGGKIVECSTKKTIFERTIEYSYVQEIYEQVKDKKVALSSMFPVTTGTSL